MFEKPGQRQEESDFVTCRASNLPLLRMERRRPREEPLPASVNTEGTAINKDDCV